MKKLIIGIITLTSVSAFAQKHMVQLSGYEDGRGAELNRSLDLYNTSGGTTHNTTTSIALNYAYAFTSALQLGAEFRSYNSEMSRKAEDKAMEYGVFGIWNFANRLTDTTYVGLKYLVGTRETRDEDGNKDADDDSMTLQAEVGHRFTLGDLWGMTYNWSPSFTLGMIGVDPQKKGYATRVEFAFNVLKVDVLF
jgi:hypothetical protein